MRKRITPVKNDCELECKREQSHVIFKTNKKVTNISHKPGVMKNQYGMSRDIGLTSVY